MAQRAIQFVPIQFTFAMNDQMIVIFCGANVELLTVGPKNNRPVWFIYSVVPRSAQFPEHCSYLITVFKCFLVLFYRCHDTIFPDPEGKKEPEHGDVQCRRQESDEEGGGRFIILPTGLGVDDASNLDESVSKKSNNRHTSWCFVVISNSCPSIFLRWMFDLCLIVNFGTRS